MDEPHLNPKRGVERKGVEKKASVRYLNPYNHKNGKHKTLVSAFEHVSNPLNVYCRTMDFFSFLGKYDIWFSDIKRNRKIATAFAKNYERYFYKPITKLKLTKPLSRIRFSY